MIATTCPPFLWANAASAGDTPGPCPQIHSPLARWRSGTPVTLTSPVDDHSPLTRQVVSLSTIPNPYYR
jgi:hypothetical protein